MPSAYLPPSRAASFYHHRRNKIILYGIKALPFGTNVISNGLVT